MIKESEQYAEEDKAIKDKIDAKNQFENYIYQMKNSVEDKDKLADKISEEDKGTIQDALTDASDWLNANSDAERSDFDDKLKELQSVCDPIIAQVYQQAGGQGGAGGGRSAPPWGCGGHLRGGGGLQRGRGVGGGDQPAVGEGAHRVRLPAVPDALQAGQQDVPVVLRRPRVGGPERHRLLRAVGHLPRECHVWAEVPGRWRHLPRQRRARPLLLRQLHGRGRGVSGGPVHLPGRPARPGAGERHLFVHSGSTPGRESRQRVPVRGRDDVRNSGLDGRRRVPALGVVSGLAGPVL